MTGERAAGRIRLTVEEARALAMDALGALAARIPGERGTQTRQRRRTEGVEIERKIYDALGRLSEGNLNHGGRGGPSGALQTRRENL